MNPLLPNAALLLYSFVRKEAVLSSQIEGTQSSLADLLKTHRTLYYELLNEVRLHGDWERWLDFFAEGIEASATQAVATACPARAGQGHAAHAGHGQQVAGAPGAHRHRR